MRLNLSLRTLWSESEKLEAHFRGTSNNTSYEFVSLNFFVACRGNSVDGGFAAFTVARIYQLDQRNVLVALTITVAAPISPIGFT